MENKLNNHVDNLEWCTASMNMQHALNTKLVVRHKGEKATNNKLSKEGVLDIFKNKGLVDQEELAKKYNITSSNVSLIQKLKSREEEIYSSLLKEEIEIINSRKTFKKVRKSKPILELDKNNNIIKTYLGINVLAKELQLNESFISQVANGKRGSAKGRFFIYKQKFEDSLALNRDLENERKTLE